MSPPLAGDTGAIAVDDVVRGLVDLAVAGDRAAFAGLYERHMDLVYRFVLRRVGNVTVAEDLTQDVFVRALRAIGKFSWQGADFAAWLLTIARNLIADHFKRGSTRMERATADMADGELADSPEQIVMTRSGNQRLRAEVAALLPAQRDVIEGRFFDELAPGEVAQRLGRNAGAVKTTQWRAIQTLRKQLISRPEAT